MGLLESKVIVVTGGSLGIGFECAQKCVAEGATVVIAARNETDLQAALQRLKQMGGKEPFCYSLDVGNYQEVLGFREWCSERFAQIHGLVNCAGIYGPIGKTTEVDMSEFSKAIQINFLGVVYMCHAFVPILRSSSRKKIVNYSGGGAATPFPYYSAYATSKVAIARFTENLSLELCDEACDVNCVAPGFVITRLHEDTLKAGPDCASLSFYENTKKQMDGGGVPPEKAADLTVFLLSSESDGITGKFISAPWDPWQEKLFQDRLRADRDFASIRRIDDKTFFKKNSTP